SMVTQPMENEAWSSKTGVNVVPALVVFQTPPAATATYHVRVSRGSTATSTTRPETMAGPMPRSSRPEKSVSSYLGGAANVAAATQKARARRSAFFMRLRMLTESERISATNRAQFFAEDAVQA